MAKPPAPSAAPKAPAFAQDSRYADAPVRMHVTATGRRIAYVLPRIVPPPEAFEEQPPHLVTDSDRLDLIAHQRLGQAPAWWLIADANRAVDPDALLSEPGDTLAIPIPTALRVRR
jgi:nucleoid-associated protein YgaU